jgi:methylglyoxal synthase
MPESCLRIALVSHDAKKPALVEWASSWREALSRHRLCGTGTTAGEVMQACAGLQVEELLSGPKGGDLQVGARIAMRQLDALVFFVDPGSPHAHENDVQALIRISLGGRHPGRPEPRLGRPSCGGDVRGARAQLGPPKMAKADERRTGLALRGGTL